MRWYSYLKNNGDENKGKALLDFETLDDNNLVICQKMEYLNFGKFANYLDFAKFMIKDTPVENRCFYEVIFGNNTQKPYFDIEFYTEPQLDNPSAFYLPENEADESVKCLTSAVISELSEVLNLEEKDVLTSTKSHILVFTSHSEKRKSYHVVIEGFCVANYKENKEFHDRVISRIPERWKRIVDHSMYKSVQQFRIVCNTKWKSSRYKTLNVELTLNSKDKRGWRPRVKAESQEHSLIILLEASLVSFTSRCRSLPYTPKEEKPQFSPKSQTDGDSVFNPLTPADIKEALALCYTYAGLEFGDPRFPYSYLKIIESNSISSLILLKRHRPSTCAICDRLHENENPYLIIAGENRDVYLDCRRNILNKKLHVGCLGKIEVQSPVKKAAVTTKIQPPKPPPFNIEEFKIDTITAPKKETNMVLKFKW